MTDAVRKEELSKSYLNAICAVKGISMEVQTHDDDGIDVILKKIIKRENGNKYNAQISVQLKSTSSNYNENPDYYTYPLKKKNYDDLLMPATLKSYLFLLIMPKNENDWVIQSIEELIIRKCMYWLDLKGFPEQPNETSVTVYLPKSNIVTSDTLENILMNIAEEDLL